MKIELPVILWFRKDLRLFDHPALIQAANYPIIPLYIWDERDPYIPGGASQWWLHKSLISLQKSLNSYGVKLILRRGDPLKILESIVKSYNVSGIYWSRCYEPYSMERDKKIKEFFKPHIHVQSFNASLLTEPWTLKTQAGSPYQIFTSYWKVLKSKGDFQVPLSVPTKLNGYSGFVLSDDLESWNLHSTSPDWSQGLEKDWEPGEEGGQKNLSFFVDNLIQSYEQNRDFPDLQATSRLSPYLHWGEISPRQVWYSTMSHFLGNPSNDAWVFLRELAWREFSYYLLYHFPELPQKPLRNAFSKFPWIEDQYALFQWQKGMTGYPIVDAGMRQLWHTGWMPNRVRMIVASFLVKDLLISWQVGASWFLDTLVDADLASNSASWQWVTGCGVDAAPYFRIFNPILQGIKFDPQGNYVRRWIPELGLLPDQYIHNPWKAPSEILRLARVKLGGTYPFPLIDHTKARHRALEAFKTSKLL